MHPIIVNSSQRLRKVSSSSIRVLNPARQAHAVYWDEYSK